MMKRIIDACYTHAYNTHIMKNTQKSNNNTKNVKLVPLADRVLIEPIIEEPESKTKSGIYLPDSIQKEKPEEGIVIAVGEGKYESGQLVPMRVKVGDKVIFSKYAYEQIKVDGKEYYMFKEENILAIIT